MTVVDQRTAGAVNQKPSRARISIVDDDSSIREALKTLMRSVSFTVYTFGSAEEFLNSQHLNETDCLILDVYLPEMNGFDLQDHLSEEHHRIPIIFITAHADDSSRQRALKGGARDLLSKPVRRDVLFKAIDSAIAH